MRARNIKPQFFADADLIECEPLARLLFIGLWCYADREGRFKWHPKQIKLTILPGDNCDIDKLLDQLMSLHFITCHDKYGYIRNFSKHQNPHPHEKNSEIPPPPENINNNNVIASNDITRQVSEKQPANPSDTRIPDTRIPDTRIPDTRILEKSPPSVAPSKEDISESSIPKIKDDLEGVCELLYQEKIFPKVHVFKNKMLKYKANPRALLHTLVRCQVRKPEDPWGYCLKTLKVEDGNFNERDFQKTV